MAPMALPRVPNRHAPRKRGIQYAVSAGSTFNGVGEYWIARLRGQ